MATGGRIIWDDPVFNVVLNSVHGPVGRHLARCGEVGAQGAKRRAPTSPDGSNGRPSGYGRSQIGWQIGTDSEGLFVDISSPATTPNGYPYMWGVEVGTAAHIIRSHGPYPLRNRKTGQVFGREVHHPGTQAQPHLRPALDDIRAM
jgi:hypothetical protein